MTYEIKITGDTAQIYTPYNADFVAALKNGVGGARWNASSRCWTVPAATVNAVREIMRRVYGRDDQTAGKTVRVRLHFDVNICETRAPVTIFGHCIARAFGRDSGAKPGEGVIYLEGGCTSGGSRSNWDSIVEKGSVVELTAVQEAIIEAEKDDLNTHITYEIMDEKPAIDAEALKAERERLLTRLAEIDEILKEETP